MEYILGTALLFFIILYFLNKRFGALTPIKKPFCLTLLLLLSFPSWAASGKWMSKVTGTDIAYQSTEAHSPKKDFAGNYLTVVYLENLGFKKNRAKP